MAGNDFCNCKIINIESLDTNNLFHIRVIRIREKWARKAGRSAQHQDAGSELTIRGERRPDRNVRGEPGRE